MSTNTVQCKAAGLEFYKTFKNSQLRKAKEKKVYLEFN